MKSDFGRSGRTTALLVRQRQRQKLFIFGGVGLLFLMAFIAVVTVKFESADASEKINSHNQVFADDGVNIGTVVLYVPLVQVPQGAQLGTNNMKEEYWPREKVPKGAVRDLEDVKEMYAKISLPPGQPILRENLQSTAPLDSGIEVPPGHRAVTIEVDATTGVDGYVIAGRHVDVLLTYLDSTDGINKTRIVVEDAIVMSFAGNTGKGGGDNEARPLTKGTANVTLSMSLENTLKIMTAKALGKISLVLRGSGSNEKVSPEDKVFSATTWRESKRETKEPAKFVRKGTAVVGGKTYVLDDSKRWFETDESGRE